ncbi:MAG: glutathione transferase GstA [Pigmentiphaga sp.]|nr:glutathione transferase GstA [Pigmentiphaga sp.]
MKLYYKPGACSLAPHIVANEAGIKLDLVPVDLATKRTADGQDYLQVNPNGFVPALALDGGVVLTEVSVLVQYLADQSPDSGLIPEAGSMARYRVLEALSFTATELHKNLGIFFRPDTLDAVKTSARALLTRRIGYVEAQLSKQAFIAGEAFTVADAYLWTVLNWTAFAGFDLSPFPHVQAWQAKVAARPAVQRTLREEGLA